MDSSHRTSSKEPDQAPEPSIPSRAHIVFPPETDESSSRQANSPPLRSSKSGWDGKLRLSDIKSPNRDSSSTEADINGNDNDSHDADDEGHVETDTDDDTLVEPHLQNTQSTAPTPGRTATVTTGEPIPGGIIPNEEELLAEYPDDALEIDAIHSRISSITKLGLERFTKLERLCLRQNEITDMSTLPEGLASTLEELDFYDNLIKHIKGLEKFEKLTSLDLSFNNIKHIKKVNHLKNLTDLYFVQNRISKIEELDGLDKVKNLELGGNQLRVSLISSFNILVLTIQIGD
jgi:Leucine-rich repeat (LRR) protein